MATSTTKTTTRSRARKPHTRRTFSKYNFKRARRQSEKRRHGTGHRLEPGEHLVPYIEALVYECGRRQWGPAKLAEESGVSYGTAAKHLCGDIKRPQAETQLWLLNAVDIGSHLIALA